MVNFIGGLLVLVLSFVSPMDVGEILDVKSEMPVLEFKDSKEEVISDLYSMGYIYEEEGQVNPERYVVNGEILFMLARYSDLTYETNYTYYGDFWAEEFIRSLGVEVDLTEPLSTKDFDFLKSVVDGKGGAVSVQEG